MAEAEPPTISVAPNAAAEVLLSTNGTSLIVVEGAAVAIAVVAAIRSRLGGSPTIDDLAGAWRVGVETAGGERLSALIAIVRDGRATIVHAGDLAIHAIGGGVPRPLVQPHTGAGWLAPSDGWPAPSDGYRRSPLRVRTRGVNLPGPAGHPVLVEVELGRATRIAITSASVWAPLGETLLDRLARDIPATALVNELVTAATATSTPIANVMSVVPRVCVVIAITPPQVLVAPAPIPTAGQRTARRAIRTVLARTVGSRAAVLVGDSGSGKTTVLEQLARAGALDASSESVSTAQVRRALKSGAPIASVGSVALVDRLVDALADTSAGLTLADAISRGALALVTTARRDELTALANAHRSLHDELAVIELAEPTGEELLAIVTAWSSRFSSRHRVRIEPDALGLAVELSGRFGFGRAQPEAALFVLEQACLRAGSASVVTGTLGGRGGGVCDRAAVIAAVADQSGIASDLVVGDDDARARELAPRLAGRLHGQAIAAAAVATAVERGLERKRLGGDAARRPIASLLLLGPTGTGKTETARLLAECWFLGRQAMTTIDLSEYREPSSIHRLIGAPPGYLGHGERPMLATVLAARPRQVILFDEIEKAHPDVHTLMLQILDEGRLTTGQGETIRFSDAIVVLTSNLAGDAVPRVGFGPGRTTSDETDRAALSRALRPELVARLDAVVRYAPLEREAATTIALGHLARAADALIATGRLAPARLPSLRQRVLARIAAQTGFAGGARELLRAVEDVLVEERTTTPVRAAFVVVYPYLEAGRERSAAGFVIELAPGVDPAAVADEVLTHPAGASLLYVSHGASIAGTRLIALVGERAAADEIAAALVARGHGSTAPVCASGRIRADLAGRPVGELIDRLLAR